jgi:cbb3-type cytochrome oxidase subunit 1
MSKVAWCFIRWGAGFMLLGSLSGYGPLAHYLHGGVEVACPWAPVHGHIALLGWVGMTLFGLVYRVLPPSARAPRAASRLATVHLWLCVVSVLGVWANGIFGYRYLNGISPQFYYENEMSTLQVWLGIDGAFLTLFAVGGLIFLGLVWTAGRGATDSAAAD